jgi:hypothetical protein
MIMTHWYIQKDTRRCFIIIIIIIIVIIIVVIIIMEPSAIFVIDMLSYFSPPSSLCMIVE